MPLDGVSNLRDLGGWPASGGVRVRFGEIYRSAVPATPTAEDCARLSAMGLRTLVDLRSEPEKSMVPLRLDCLGGVPVEELPVDPSLGVPLHRLAAAYDKDGDYALGLLRHAYASYARDWSHQYARLLELLADPACRPLLFFCSAGKDRTGFGAALVLAALGVGREAIRADYLQTNVLWRGDEKLRALLPPAIAEVLMAAHAELLDVAFAAMREDSGSVAGYLERRLGLDAERCRRLRADLLVAGPGGAVSGLAPAADGEQARADDHHRADYGPEVGPGAEDCPAEAG